MHISQVTIKRKDGLNSNENQQTDVKSNEEDSQPIHISMLAQSYGTTVNVFGRFRQELLQLHQLYAQKSSRRL